MLRTGNRSNQWSLLAAVLATVGLSAASQLRAAHAQPDGRPNVLVILTDDQGYGDLGAFGATDLKTPYLDCLLSQGMKLTEFYATCPVCSPTRAALLSGRFQDMVGVPGVIRTHAENNWGYLDPQSKLLSSLFRDAGYHTAIVGKWHLGLEAPNRPNDRGFDFFHGFLGDMMDDYYTHRRHGINYLRKNDEEIETEGHATELFSQWSCDYLRGRRGQREPFFLYLAYNAPHTPIQPPEEWIEKVKQREPGSSDRRAKLVALIEHMDAGIGQVLDCLEETGFAENTLVFFTSDNGGQSNVGANNGPLRDGKGTVYEGGIKVPCGVRWPQRIKPKSESSFMATTMDILPTALEAAGIDVPDDLSLDGASFLPTLLGEEQPPLREYWFFRRREGGNRYMGKTIDAVRWGDWKLLQNSPFEPLELYNLQDDPLEERNLARQEQETFHRLTAVLRNEIQRYGTVAWQKPRSTEAEAAIREDAVLETFVSEFIKITPGEGQFPAEFPLGSETEQPDENPRRNVTLSKSFRIGKYEVWQDLYERVMGTNPSRWKGPRNSAEQMTWEEANEFCRKATLLLREHNLIGEDERVRLPTEAEWEYCCRAGTETAYSFGNDPRQEGDAGNQASRLDAYAWHTGNAAGNDPAVGSLKPNPWGLYDVHGYLWEFTADHWTETNEQAAGKPHQPVRNESGQSTLRGGSWREHYSRLTSSSRKSFPIDARSDDVGFRCVLVTE